MRSRQMPLPSAVPLLSLIGELEQGLLKVPQFQRDFVWGRKDSANLIDSLLQGFPIGTFILWKTKEELRIVRNIGGRKFPKTPKGEFTKYVLDGQQRITSIFAALRGVSVPRDNKEVDFSSLYIDLDADGDDLVITDVSDKEPYSYVAVYHLLTQSLFEPEQQRKYSKENRKKMADYRDTLQSYSASVVEVPSASIDIATEIFTRINVGGKSLTVFEIMVAKTFDTERNFDLSEKTEEFISELHSRGYGTVPDIVIVQTISAIMSGETKQRAILDLDKQKFIDTWPKAEKGIRGAVDYLRSTLGVPVSELLPYKSILVPLAYFFVKHPRTPADTMHDRLVDFFWRTSLSGRYSQSQDTKIAQDIGHINQILKGRLPDYKYPVNPSPEFIYQNGEFRTSRAFIKAVLCLFAGNKPRRFDNHSSHINVNNDFLKQANSKNYHHFFPKKVLDGERDLTKVNHIVNITIIDEESNKGEIGAKKPSEYMAYYRTRNRQLAATMKTHFIDLKNDGIWNKEFGGRGNAKDDYDTFFYRRCRKISAELTKKLIKRPIDRQGQRPNAEDVDS